MPAERPDAIESPLTVPELDPNEPTVEFATLPKNPKIAELPPIPRDVSTTAKLVLLFGPSQSSTFGWLWLCLSAFFALVFLGSTRLGTALLDRGAVWEPFSVATLVSCEPGNVNINGRNDYEWRFSGPAPDGSYFEGVSRSLSYREPGSLVAVEKKAGTVDVLRAEGTSTAPFGDSLGSLLFAAAFLSIFLILGVCLALIGPIRRGLRTIPLLRSGVPAQAVLVDLSPTGTQVGGRSETKATYRFQAADGGEREASARGFQIDRLTDEPAEILLYSPEDPRRSVVLDELPASVQTVPGQGFTARSFELFVPLIGAAVLLAEIGLTLKTTFQVDRAVFSTEPPSAAARFDPSAALRCPGCENGTPCEHSRGRSAVPERTFDAR